LHELCESRLDLRTRGGELILHMETGMEQQVVALVRGHRDGTVNVLDPATARWLFDNRVEVFRILRETSDWRAHHETI
jgi:hypothetical protein